MLRKRAKIYLLLVIFLLVISAVFVWWQQNKAEPDVINWDNPDYLFNIDIPPDFTEDQLDKVATKLAEAKQAYQEKPGDNWTWDMLGNLYEFVGDYERALVVYQRALFIQPVDITAILNTANIYEKYMVDYTKAEDYYSQAISVFSNQPDLYDRLAQLYWHKMNRLSDAEITYLESLDKTSDKPDAFLDIITFYEQTGQTDKEKEYVRKLLDRFPDNELYQSQYGDLVK